MKKSLLYISIVFPALVLIYFSAEFAVDLPFWDQFNLIMRLDNMDKGESLLHALWAQHNEHRLFFPLAIMYFLGLITDWNINAEIGLVAAIGIAAYALLLFQWRGLWLKQGVSALYFPLFTGFLIL